MDLYEVVKRNRDFYNDKQWEGLNAPNLEKGMFNFLKPVINYMVAVVISNDISASVEVQSPLQTSENKVLTRVVSSEFDGIIENSKMKQKLRRLLTDCAIEGDCALYTYFDSSAETGQYSKGQIEIELIDNLNLHFGNVIESDPQRQPYIIISARRLLEKVKEEARRGGMSESEIEALQSDSGTNIEVNENETEYCTVLTKLYKENGTVKVIKSTATAIVMPEKDTGLFLYPISYMSWERIKDSYHGNAAITGKIQNQVIVNKLYSMCLQFVKMFAFPKVIYDIKMFPNGYSNEIGKAIGVNGDPTKAVLSPTNNIGFNEVVLNLIDRVMQQTKELMGASDAALGNVKPDNMGAIIVTQKASATPLELQKMDFYQLVEDNIRIFIDMMRCYYGKRYIKVTNEESGEDEQILFDFEKLKSLHLKLNVDIGPSSYFSELAQVQTLDNIFARGLSRDTITYLENIPDGYIKNKSKLIDNIRKKLEEDAGAVGGIAPQMGGTAQPSGEMPQQMGGVEGLIGKMGQMPMM